MTYEVTGRNRKINFGATGVDEVLQNVAMILTTPRGTVPLRRSWFIDGGVLDLPQPVAKARLAQEIVVAIRNHEPRARIKGAIRFVETPEEALDGKIVPAVTVEVVL